VGEGAGDGGRAEFAMPRRPQKSDAAFRTISEVSEDLDVPQHVLRFWESRFPLIKPLKRGGGRRYYRPEDVQLLRKIRDLLYKDGYTIRGVQKLLRDQLRGSGVGVQEPAAETSAAATSQQSVAVSPLAPPPAQPSLALEVVVPPSRPAEPVAAPQAAAAPPEPRPQPATASAPAHLASASPGGITGARRALIETVLGEIDALRQELADAVKKPAK
jgi:DNA-binding transcriptional MerR regulator